MTFENVYAVILAGGSGTRFWPQSRQLRPKQLCKIASPNKTMLEQTLERLDGLIPPERRIVVTHQDQAALTLDVINNPKTIVLKEPVAKNTTAALAYAALFIEGIHPSATKGSSPIMISLHADHVIREKSLFVEDLKRSVAVAKLDKLTLLGIDPNYPATCYGYIKLGSALGGGAGSPSYFDCGGFKEKPEFATAAQYVESGNYLWNSGIFIWKTGLMLSELNKFHPEYLSQLKFLKDEVDLHSETYRIKLQTAYNSLSSLAIDHSLLENSSSLAVLKSSFTWFDVGSWDSLKGAVIEPDHDGNLICGKNVFVKDVKDCVLSCDENSVVAAIGVSNLVISTFNGATLVAPLNRSQEVKDVVDGLKKMGLTQFT